MGFFKNLKEKKERKELEYQKKVEHAQLMRDAKAQKLADKKEQEKKEKQEKENDPIKQLKELEAHFSKEEMTEYIKEKVKNRILKLKKENTELEGDIKEEIGYIKENGEGEGDYPEGEEVNDIETQKFLLLKELLVGIIQSLKANNPNNPQPQAMANPQPVRHYDITGLNPQIHTTVSAGQEPLPTTMLQHPKLHPTEINTLQPNQKPSQHAGNPQPQIPNNLSSKVGMVLTFLRPDQKELYNKFMESVDADQEALLSQAGINIDDLKIKDKEKQKK